MLEQEANRARVVRRRMEPGRAVGIALASQNGIAAQPVAQRAEVSPRARCEERLGRG